MPEEDDDRGLKLGEGEPIGYGRRVTDRRYLRDGFGRRCFKGFQLLREGIERHVDDLGDVETM